MAKNLDNYLSNYLSNYLTTKSTSPIPLLVLDGIIPLCTNLTSNEFFSLAIVGILTDDVYTENLLQDGSYE